MKASYRRVHLFTDTWFLRNVAVAGSFRQRLCGIHAAPGGVLIPTSSIHTMGLRTPIVATFIDGSGRVLGSQVVPKRSIVTDRRAQWILEHQLDHEPLRPDAVLRVVASSDHGRSTGGLRNADREPR